MAAGKPGGGREAPARPGVYLTGLADLRKVLAKIDRNLAKGMAAQVRAIGRAVKTNAQSEARRFRDDGDLERSIRYSVTAKQASVYSNAPHAEVNEWGGVIRPRGVPIRFPRRLWMHEGVSKSRRVIDSGMESLLDDMADTWDG